MPRLIWSPTALLDVQGLYRFLAEKNIGELRGELRGTLVTSLSY